jgi:hypothetical protein
MLPKINSNKVIYLHFGCHKTGSTSLQMFLKENKSYLNQNNFDIMNTFAGRDIDLSLFCLRKSILNFTNPSFSKTKILYKNILFKIKITLFFLFTKENNFIFSDEGLDYIRTQKEIDNIKSLFPSKYKIIPILIIRDKKDWINSWRNYLISIGLIDHLNRDSPYFSGDSSWYFKINLLIDLININFKKVIYIEYEHNVIPSFLKSIGLKPPKNCNFKLNKTKYTL